MAGNRAETSLRQVFKGMMGDGGAIELMQGKVIQTDPLRIQMLSDDKLIITDRITIVPRHLTDYSVSVAIGGSTAAAAGGSGEGAFTSHSHDMGGTRTLTIYNALKKGDTVHVLSLNNGKLYYVMDKVV